MNKVRERERSLVFFFFQIFFWCDPKGKGSVLNLERLKQVFRLLCFLFWVSVMEVERHALLWFVKEDGGAWKNWRG